MSCQQPLSRYPGTERDICFQVDQNVPYATITAAVEETLSQSALIWSVSPLDIYQPEDGITKNVTIRISLTSYEKTMTNEEVTEIISNVIDRVIQITDGKVV